MKQVGLHVQYGCGFSAPAEWINFDSSLTLAWERIPILGLWTKNSRRFPANVRRGDIVRGLPVPEGSCAGIYASHVLEHLSLCDFESAVLNTLRMLAPGTGVFRTVVPDLGAAARDYVKGLDSGDPESSLVFLRATGLGHEVSRRSVLRSTYEDFSSRHLWMWDALSLSSALSAHGFRSVRVCRMGDCPDEMFRLVESPGRFSGSVAVEAIR